jgi:pilus assembly protein CpaF
VRRTGHEGRDGYAQIAHKPWYRTYRSCFSARSRSPRLCEGCPLTIPVATSVPALLVDEVREQVRMRGVDPARDALAVRRLAEDAARRHERRSLTGAVDALPDEPAAVGEIVARVSGLGPLQPLLDDPEVEEIWINDPSRVFIARHGRHELTPIVLSTQEVRDLVERMLKWSGRRLDLSQPFVDAMLPGGHRLHMVLDGICRDFVAVNLRKFVARAHRLDDLVPLGTLTPDAARFLDVSIRAGLSVLVSGGTQAGKTTMLNCLAASIPGNERVVSCEEVFELRFQHPDWVPLQTRQAGLEGTGEVRLRHLVKESLRMRPSRLVVGEVRAEECLDMLLALNAGLPGMASVHANSAREALLKVCTLPLLAGENIGSRFVVPTVAAAVDLVVQLSLGPDGIRRVDEVVAVSGRVEADVIETEVVFVRRDGALVRGGGRPPHSERFARVGVDIGAVLAGDR